jgi:hypothetical protein
MALSDRETVASRREVERLLRQRVSLSEVIASISSELELRPLLTRIIRHACELLDADNGSIGLYDRERGVMRIEADFNMQDDNIGTEMSAGPQGTIVSRPVPGGARAQNGSRTLSTRRSTRMPCWEYRSSGATT